MRSFAAGDTRVVCNVDLFGEGVDVPGIEAAILLRPTQSLSLYLQQVGRALRPAPGKAEAIILDHAGNALRHGLPADDREWSLYGERRSRRSRDPDDVPVRHCEQCFRILPRATRICECGQVLQPTEREVLEVDGLLQEMHHSALRRTRAREQGSAQTLDELIRLGTMRGYRNPAAWARHVYNARRQRG
jgi:superfamily II DNA or RNA helicase